MADCLIIRRIECYETTIRSACERGRARPPAGSRQHAGLHRRGRGVPGRHRQVRTRRRHTQAADPPAHRARADHDQPDRVRVVRLPRTSVIGACVSAFQQLRRGGRPGTVHPGGGYLLYRIGDCPEIVAQKLCEEHRGLDWASELPASARFAWCPHMPQTPSRVVYSLGGIRDDSSLFRDYFSNFPEWDTDISFLLTPVRREYSAWAS